MENQDKHEVFVPQEAPPIAPGTIVRFIVFAVALVNAVASLLGHELGLKVDQNTLYDVLSALFLMGSSLHMAWKNNNITKQARIKAHATEQITIEKKGDK
ncbi:holin [Bacillus phage Riley]|uniref:Holin n=3 Tax=Bequatrovirus TaxID=1917990 RepID=A0A075LZU3_9CAUD|nr:holin [Bacillus phage Riley]YP_009206526.1 holin [Bacillus phage AvesoBmore]AIF72042.1 holin [Bacillus phage Riley]ALA13336.1 holin [Bacillus phage AvesoBmore]ASZ75898.1 holin [Bacillus phage Taffo16]